MKQAYISITGAKEHNLKNISLKIPRNKLTVITGVSGSGKSSLAFDTLYAEGQRRYVESLSSYARQFLENLKRPEVESIQGLSPAIAIEQQGISKNPRSTVGTVTEIFDYLRILYARIGHAYCVQCNQEITSQSFDQIMDAVQKKYLNKKIILSAPIVRDRKGEYQKELHGLREQGFVKVKIDGTVYDLSDEIHLDRNKKHSIDVYVDKLKVTPDITNRLRQSVLTALSLAGHLIKVEDEENNEQLFNEKFSCLTCGLSFPEIEPRFFSFNSAAGACPKCKGLGIEGAFNDLDAFLNTEDLETVTGDRSLRDLSPYDFFHEIPCQACKGTRFKKEVQFVRIQNTSLSDVCDLSLPKAYEFFKTLSLTKREKIISDRILKEITDRLGFLLQVGVGYLTLSRRSSTLSGGEGQRIRLATQIGSSLTGVLYILDEPSIGLHPIDNLKLIGALKELRNRGNTVIVVEHDAETMQHADHIIDMGPKAGIHGGRLVSQGKLLEVLKDPKSLTGQYLSFKKEILVPQKRRKATSKAITLTGACENNLKNLDISFPLGLFIGISGVSGSGKSSLMIDTLFRALSQKLHHSKTKVGKYASLSGIEYIDQAIVIDQSPIGKTPRSNPATYTGIFSYIRTFFVGLPEAKIRGYKAGRFSFNVPGGRCETCQGAGLVKIQMYFLPNTYVPCDLCQGKRYNRETLEIRYKDKNISDVLEMSVEEALDFFKNIPLLKTKLQTLFDVGLGYVHLGQQATTLSGGEAQRIKLSKELSKRSTGKTLFILDEPTTGLHFDDIQKLLSVLHRLVDLGNTVLVIEHHLDVLKSCDLIFDLGPEGGEKGGYILAQGAPEDIAANLKSQTGQFLKKIGVRPS